MPIINNLQLSIYIIYKSNGVQYIICLMDINIILLLTK